MREYDQVFAILMITLMTGSLCY